MLEARGHSDPIRINESVIDEQAQGDHHKSSEQSEIFQDPIDLEHEEKTTEASGIRQMQSKTNC